MRVRTTGRRAPGVRRAAVATGLVAASVLAACGDDDDDDAGTTEPAAATTEAAATTAAAPTTEGSATTEDAGGAPTTGAVTAEFAEYCAHAAEMDSQEDFPTEEQLTKAQELAPEEIREAADTAVDGLLPAVGDMVATFNAFAQDDVEEAIMQIDEFEAEHCGLESDETEPPTGSSTEVEDGATRVDVVATDYAFSGAPSLSAGRTSFVLTNEGEEAHFLLLTKLKEGTTLDEALQMEDPSGVIEGEWETGLAAAGGEDEEVVTIDLEAGTYGMLCFVPGPDGTPHAFMGMAQELTVE
jgi:hypothetical protein